MAEQNIRGNIWGKRPTKYCCRWARRGGERRPPWTCTRATRRRRGQPATAPPGPAASTHTSGVKCIASVKCQVSIVKCQVILLLDTVTPRPTTQSGWTPWAWTRATPGWPTGSWWGHYITVQYSTCMMDNTVQYSTVQYPAGAVLPAAAGGLPGAVAPRHHLVHHPRGQGECSTVQFSTVQCSTVRYSTVQCSTVQCSIVQSSTDFVFIPRGKKT